MIILSLRKYEDRHTDGKVFVNGTFFGHSLEDIGRPHGVKHPGETCIPEGAYKVSISYSSQFKRDMLIIYNIVDDHSVFRFGVRFTGIRMHGGNNTGHTAGCIMVAEHSDKQGKIHGSLESQLFHRVKQEIASGREVIWVIAEDL